MTCTHKPLCHRPSDPCLVAHRNMVPTTNRMVDPTRQELSIPMNFTRSEIKVVCDALTDVMGFWRVDSHAYKIAEALIVRLSLRQLDNNTDRPRRRPEDDPPGTRE